MSTKKTSGKGFQLNQRQWLNVMIICISAMLLLSVLVGKLISRGEYTQTEPVKPSIEITKLDFGEALIWKENEIWFSSGKALQKQAIQKLVQKWHSLLSGEKTLIEQDKETSSGRTILIYLAGNAQPVICKLISDDNHARIVFVGRKLQIMLTENEKTDYYPF